MGGGRGEWGGVAVAREGGGVKEAWWGSGSYLLPISILNLTEKVGPQRVCVCVCARTEH